MKTPERRYLNTFLIWGAAQYDPANTDNIKSVKPEFNGVYKNKVMPRLPNSRHLSVLSSTYQT